MVIVNLDGIVARRQLPAREVPQAVQALLQYIGDIGVRDLIAEVLDEVEEAAVGSVDSGGFDQPTAVI